MRSSLLFVLAFFSLNLVSAQSWQWLNPSPPGDYINDITILNANTGYAAGVAGIILRSQQL